jgi:mono/diheme cytochrome c family protein
MLLAAVLGSGLFVLTGQQPTPPSVFTLAQAEAGRAAYENTCGKCHTSTLLGRKGDPGELPPVSSLSASYREFIGPRGFVAPLTGKTFIDHWGAKTAAQLIARFQETVVSFPPEGMNDETTVNITAYVLQVNGAKAGNRPLTRATDAIVSSITGDGHAASGR